jgi:BCCT family betaine/carnitine transporter
LTIVAFVFITLAFQESAGAAFGDLRDWLTGTFDWFFLTAANVFVLLCLFLIVSPYGKVRIGGKDATPDYSYTGWFAMLFAAGMGIGLMFYGVSEPISHFSSSVAEGAGSADSWAPWGEQPATPPKRAISAWPRRSSTGACTHGRSTPLSHWRWRCFPTTRACR